MVKLYSEKKKDAMAPEKKVVDFILRYSKQYAFKVKAMQLIQ